MLILKGIKFSNQDDTVKYIAFNPEGTNEVPEDKPDRMVTSKMDKNGKAKSLEMAFNKEELEIEYNDTTKSFSDFIYETPKSENDIVDLINKIAFIEVDGAYHLVEDYYRYVHENASYFNEKYKLLFKDEESDDDEDEIEE